MNGMGIADRITGYIDGPGLFMARLDSASLKRGVHGITGITGIPGLTGITGITGIPVVAGITRIPGVAIINSPPRGTGPGGEDARQSGNPSRTILRVALSQGGGFLAFTAWSWGPAAWWDTVE